MWHRRAGAPLAPSPAGLQAAGRGIASSRTGRLQHAAPPRGRALSSPTRAGSASACSSAPRLAPLRAAMRSASSAPRPRPAASSAALTCSRRATAAGPARSAPTSPLPPAGSRSHRAPAHAAPMSPLTSRLPQVGHIGTVFLPPGACGNAALPALPRKPLCACAVPANRSRSRMQPCGH